MDLKLQVKSFDCYEDLCDFVNKKKVKIQTILLESEEVILFFWV